MPTAADKKTWVLPPLARVEIQAQPAVPAQEHSSWPYLPTTTKTLIHLLSLLSAISDLPGWPALLPSETSIV